MPILELRLSRALSASLVDRSKGYSIRCFSQSRLATERQNFAPPLASDANEFEVKELRSLMMGSKTLILSGAGLSTESGLPDYRSPLGSYSVGHKPMTHQEFVGSSLKRKRYWARSLAGVKFFSGVTPNSGHFSIAGLEKLGLINGVVTQNVDRLHQAAGSKEVLELHGNSHYVKCLSCETLYSRKEYSESMRMLNERWLGDKMEDLSQKDIRADGDAHLNTEDFDDFVVPSCRRCEGVLMPDIVFFGGTVSPEVKARSFRMVDNCDQILIVGSSVTVYSSFRLCRAAKQQGKPVVAINIGETRADDMLDLKIESRCGDVLSNLYRCFL
mmetsp:Transcript_6324/g.7699  ORF Transcript_6324/g.7699 Transcript_6324/m.7699 type:complete len:329 (+) Transcript_6324:128-1114(+)